MKLLIALFVLAAWVGLTAVAAWAVPPRDDGQPDLSLDEKWMLRVPYSPVVGDKASLRVSATTTTRPSTRGATISATRAPPSGTQGVVPRASTAGVEQWHALVSLYPWPVDTMLAIMRCESGGRPDARNSSGASGLFQLLPGPPGWQDPATNIRLAYELKYKPSGLSPWNASRGCWG